MCAFEPHRDGAGRGNEFVVRLLPLTERTSLDPVDSEDAAPLARIRPCRVLVVDDVKDLADSLALLLRRMGHDVHVAYNGRTALDSFETVRPELALVDIGLPEFDGYEVARKIRKQSWGRRIHLVALTGWGQPDDKSNALEAGFDRHMTKPVSYAELEQLTAEVAQKTAAAADRRKMARTPS
jgi:CheY-like chemotaxis protein